MKKELSTQMKTFAVLTIAVSGLFQSNSSPAGEKYPAMEGSEAKTHPVYRAENFGDLPDQVDSPARRTKSVDLKIDLKVAQLPVQPQPPAPEPNRAPAPMSEKAQKIGTATLTWSSGKSDVSKNRIAVRSARAPKQKTRAVVQQAQVKSQPKAPEKNEKFDSVPTDQRSIIAKRIEIAEKLIREYGRAYDYRVMTLAELEKVEAELAARSMGPDDALSVTAPVTAAPKGDANLTTRLSEINPRERARLQVRNELQREPVAPLPQAASDATEPPIPEPAAADSDPWKALE